MRNFITAVIIVFLAGNTLMSQTIGFTDKRNNSMSVDSGFITTYGKLGEMSKTGYGSAITYTHYNLFFSDAFAGIEIGCYYVPGKMTSQSSTRAVERTIIVPILADFGYKFFLTRSLSISPAIYSGISYFNSTYSPKEGISMKGGSGTINFIEADVKAGFNIIYRFTDSYIGVGAGYGAFIEPYYINRYFTGKVIIGYRY